VGILTAKVDIFEIRTKYFRKELTKYNQIVNKRYRFMTTNVMFRQDMKTLMKDMKTDNMQTTATGQTAWGRRSLVQWALLLFLILFLGGGVMSEAWAQTYTYNVVDESGNIVATAMSTSSTLGLPTEIKAANCVFRFYDSQTDAQNMTSTGERTTLPTGDATIYVGFRCDMRVFPTSSNGKSVYFVQQNNYLHWNDLKYNTGTNDFSAKNNDGDTWQFVGDSPYDVKITNGTYYIKIDSGDETVHGTNDASQASHFVILHSSWNTSEYNYAFRLVGSSLYLKRINNTATQALKTTSTSGTQDTSFGMYSSNSDISPRYNIYDSYGNFVFSRYDGNANWKLREFRNFSSNFAQRTSNFNVSLENWISEMNFYVSVPDNANAVPVNNVPQNDVYDINVTYTPRWEDANNPGVMVHRDGSTKLDLTGNTRYFIKINRGTGHYMYADGTSLKFKDKSVKDPGAEDSEYQWILEGGDPLHIILRSAVDGKVVSPSDFTLVRSTPSGAGAITYTMTPSTTPSISLKDYNSVDPINSNPYWALMSYSGTKSGGSPGEYLTIPGFSQSVCVINAYGSGGTSGNIDLWMHSGTSGAWDSDLSNAYITFEKVPSTEYIINIVDSHGNVAIKATADLYPGDVLGHNSIPAEIYSPYIEGETLTFYSDAACTNAITTPAEGSIAAGGNIYVRYTTDHLDEKPLHFGGNRRFNIQVNGNYIYNNGGTLANTSSDTGKDGTTCLWKTIGSDPYAIQVRSESDNNQFLTYATSPAGLTLGATGANTYFIAMKRTTATDVMVTELMAATGADLSTTDYYSVGQTVGSVTMLPGATYPHDNAAIQVALTPSATTIGYRIIDKQGKIVIETEKTPTTTLNLPAEWRSPLVSAYHYWKRTDFTESSGVYTKTGTTEASGPSDATDEYIYVTYDVNTTLDLNGSSFTSLNDDASSLMQHRHPRSGSDATQVRDALKFGKMYMLKFKTNADYKFEDTHDAVSTTTTASDSYVYPYTNGDGPMYIYPDATYQETKDNGASTRTRYPWYLVGPNNDPYHVYITSWQNSHANKVGENTYNTNYYTYLRTYYVSGLGVVTNNVTDDPRTVDGSSQQLMPTDYMILNGSGGANGAYKLMTAQPISDGTTTERRVVNSLEQYWRNNPTAQTESGGTKNVTVVATDNSTLIGKGWHNYKSYVNAAPWAGGSKSYGNDDHWFQTINLGDGSLDIEETTIDGVLVLLDNHGWEIMRQPIVATSDADYATVQAALKKYDSPMVSNYKFYWARNVDHKVAGYHKYNILEGTKALTEAGNRVNASTTYTSLANYPLYYYQGAMTDLYVTYDVKDDYAQYYTPGTTPQAAAYLVKQGTNYAKASDGGTTIETDATAGTTDDYYWQLQPNTTIDTEMGYTGESITYTTAQQGFDPYNLQIKNKLYGQYFHSNQTGYTLTGGSWEGSGPATVGLASSLGSTTAATGHDQTTLAITGATFMAVKDANGNMRLMPRFDHSKVQTAFTTLAVQQTAATANDNGSGSTQTTNLTIQRNNVKYVVVDNDGHEALRYTADNVTTLDMPACIQSPLASDYRFYATKAAATADDGGSTYSGNILYASEATEEEDGNKVVYVRYTTQDDATLKLGNNGLLHLNILGETAENLHLTINASSNNLFKGSYNQDQVQGSWLWYTPSNDPYDIVLKNYAFPEKFFVKGDTYNSDAARNYLSLTDTESGSARFALLYNNYSAMTGYTLMLIPASSSELPMFLYGDGGNNKTVYLWTGGGADNNAALTSANRSGNNGKTVITPLGVTYFVINKAGNIAIYGSRTDQTEASTPDLPAKLKTSLATNYRYFTDFDRTQEITDGTLPSSQCNVYVTYDVVASPSLDLSGATQYNIYFDNDESYTYDGQGTGTAQGGKNHLGSSYGQPIYHRNDKDDETHKTAPYLWTISNDDPYNVQINSTVSSERYWITTLDGSGTDQHWLGLAYSNNRQMNPYILIDNGDGTWALMTACRLRDGEYYYLSKGVNEDRVDASSNNAANSDNVRLCIKNPFEVTVTYHITDGTNVLANATVKDSYNKTPKVPNVLASELADYTYYKNADCSEAFGADETIGSSTTDIYVKAPLLASSPFDLRGTEALTAIVNGEYLLDSNDDRWYVVADGQHPYKVKLKRVSDNKYLAVNGTVTSSTEAATLDVTTDATGSTFFLRECADGESYELVLATTELDYFNNRYYTLGLDGSGNIKFISSDTKSSGNADLATLLVKNELTYHVINLSGREALQYTPASIPGNYDTGFPDQFRSPLAKNYKYYKRGQFTSTVVDGKAVYTLKSGEAANDFASLNKLEEVQPGDVFVTYEYDATAGIDLSGATSYGMFINGNDAKGYRMLGIRTNDNNKGVGVYTQPFQGEKCYSWYVKGSTNNDPYNVTFQNLWSNNYQYPNSGKIVVGGSTASTPFMILTGANPGRYEIAYMDGSTLRRLYYLGNSYDDIFNSGTSFNDTKPHETAICQVAFNPLYIYHIINFEGKEAISAPGVLAEGETTELAVPDLICSPLVDKFYYYNADDVTVSDGIYTVKVGASPITTLDEVTNGNYNIYVFYKKSDINPRIDLTGQTSYNIEFNGGDNKQHFYRYDASVLDLANTADPTDATSADFLWVLKGQDPYKIQFYNIAQGLSTPITMTSAGRDGTNGYVVSNNSSHKNFAGYKTNANSFIITKGVDDNHYEVLVAYTSGRTYPSQLGSDFYHYLAYFRSCASITNNAAIYHLTTEKCHKLTLTPTANARHTYIVVNKRGYEALRMTVDGAKNAAPQVPVQLRSPLATNFKCYEYVEPVSGKYSPTTELTNTGSDDIKILVTYDLDETKTDINLNGEGYYFLKTNNLYDHTDDGELQIIADGTYDEDRLGYYAWQFDAAGDPYDVTLRLAGVSNKALGTPDYTNTQRRRAAAKHHILRMYDDSSDNVMTFAVLSGANQQNMTDATGRYALVVSSHDKVTDTGNVADITGNQFNYIGREADSNPGRLYLLQGDLTVSSDAVQIDNYDDPSQTTIEPVVLHYHYHIMAPETGHAVIEEYTCTDDDGAAAGMLAADAFPDALRRLGCPPSKMRFYASASALSDGDLTTAYDNANSGLQLSLDKLHIYARYEVDDDELPFYYSGSLSDLAAAAANPSSADLDNWDWNLWEIKSDDWYLMFKSDHPLALQRTLNNEDYTSDTKRAHWAFFGDPYRTQIVNRARWESETKILGLHSFSASGTGANLTTDAVNSDQTVWEYALFAEGGQTMGVFFLKNYTYTGTDDGDRHPGNRYYMSLVQDNIQVTPNSSLHTFAYLKNRILPLRAQVVFHIINRQQKHSTTFVGPKVAVNSSCNLNTVINDLGYPNATINNKYFYTTASVSSDGIYTLSDAVSTPDSYTLPIGIKYRHVYMNYNYGEYWGNSGADKHGNKYYTISWTENKTKNYLYVNDEGEVAITSTAPVSLYEKAYLWRVEAPKVGNNYDSYGMKLYNLSNPTKPVKLNDDYTLSLGTEDEAQTFVFKRNNTDYYTFVAENQDPTYKMPYNQYRTLWIGNDESSDVLAKMERLNIDNKNVGLYLKEVSFTFHIYNLQGKKAIGRKVSDAGEITELFDSDNFNVPSVIRSPLVQDGDWHFWKDEASATAGSGNVLTALNLIDAAGNIYVTYDYDPSAANALDLTGEMYYNIYHPMFNNNNTNGDYNVFWIYNDAANSFVHYGREADGKLNHAVNYWSKASTYNYSFDVLDDNVLWTLVGADPYAITIENYAARGVSASLNNDKVQIQSGKTALQAFIVKSAMDADSEYDEYELILADGSNTLKHFYGSNSWSSDNDDYVYVGSVGSNPTEKYRIRFVPRSVDYYYNIINLNGEKALVYTGKGIQGKTADKLPASIQSPLAENFRFYGPEQVTESTTDGVTTYTVNSGEEPIDVFPSTVDAGGNTILPELYVFYDPVASDDVNLSAGRYYFLKANGKYSKKAGSVTELVNEPVKTRAEVGDYLWMLDANGDPYDMKLRVTGYETMLLDGNNLEEGGHNTSFAIGSDVEAFCLLPGKSTDSKLYTFVAASGDAITDNRFAYLANGSSQLQLVRGDDYTRETPALQMELEIPTFNYRYRVVNLSDKIAIQYTVQDGQTGSQSGAKPVIPDAIKTPFADYTGYYLENQYTIGGTDPVDIENMATTYALNDSEQSLDVDGSGGLPYYDADIYVEYEYNNSKTLDVTGNKFYNLKTDADSKYAYNNGGTISTTATAPSPLATDKYMWALNGKVTVAGNEVVDPYQITLTDYETTPKTQGTYVVQPGAADGQWVLTKTGTTANPTATTSPTDFSYLTSDGSVLTDATATLNTASRMDKDGAQLWFKGIPVKINYAVLSKTKGWIAIKGDFMQEGGDAPSLPDLIKSPLAYNYQYHASATENGTVIRDLPNNNYETVYTAGPELSLLPYGETTVYVTYDYDNGSSPIDLSGLVKYNISSGEHYVGAKDESIAKSNYYRHQLQNIDSPDKTILATKNYIWRLTGNDPYNLQVSNLACPETYTRDSNTTSYHLTINNNFDNAGTHGADPNVSAEFSGTFCLLNGYTKVDNAQAYALVVTFPHAQAGNYYNNHPLMSNGRNSYLFFCYNSSDRSPNATGFSDSSYIWGYQQGGYSATDNTTVPFATLVFTPNQTQPVKYHLTKQITDVEMTHEDPNVPVRSLITLPDNWERKYCDYTYTYYYIENGHKEEGEYLDVPITKEEYEAKSTTKALDTDVEITDANYKSATASVVPVVYIEVDETTQEPKEGQKLDIYIDYTVRDYGEPDGIPFRRMAKERPIVNALLTNYEGITDYAFNITSYENLMGEVPVHVIENGSLTVKEYIPRKDFLYFMVLNTNDDFSRGNQYFLRREDNGRVAWLNNDYRIHVASSQNINGWDYSRCAESYKPNDHSVFEEKRSLWAFAGDPYDMYIYNAGAVVEERFNELTGAVDVNTHRTHVTSWTRLSDSEVAAYTPDHSLASPPMYCWGLTDGKGTKSDQTFSIVAGQTDDEGKFEPTNADEQLLYWQMKFSNKDRKNEVLLQPRTESFNGLDYNIKVLPYSPKKYEDVRLVIRRDDKVAEYMSYLEGKSEKNPLPYYATGVNADPGKLQDHMSKIDALGTGTVRMFTSDQDRLYVKGDVITADNMPNEVRRAFSEYTLYEDDFFDDENGYTVTYGSVRGNVQRYAADVEEGGKTIHKAGDIIYNEVGMPMYNYYAVNPETGEALYVIDHIDGGVPVYKTDGSGNKIRQGAPPQTVYVKYEVTSDIFLKQHPTKAQVAEMKANNDHVYFMDFPDPKMLGSQLEGYNTGHHAYFDEKATFQEQIGSLYQGEVEKMKWDGSKFVGDQTRVFNKCQYKTTANRMTSVPEDLKWYFVGDPYAVQVYNTNTTFGNDAKGETAENLARFDPTESRFQFVVDCVHMRTPDTDIIDEREEIEYTDENGEVLGTVENANFGKPYYSNFYWEVVPTPTGVEGGFALRFRANNQLLGYTNVYYYLGHDGLSRIYNADRKLVAEGQSQKGSYNINLCYRPDNRLHLSGKYRGYHEANNDTTVIRLIQPTKVYFSAYKDTEGDHTTFNDANRVTKEELSEYFGVGETLYEVPRHLQRKFVKYCALGYQKNNNATWNSAKFPVVLDPAKTTDFDETNRKVGAYNMEDCKTTGTTPHTLGIWVFKDTGKHRASYKFRVLYDVDDETKDGIHLFTTDASNPQWLDVMVGNANWLYYDKTNVDGGSPAVENKTSLVSNYRRALSTNKAGWNNDANGWEDGLKGLHWAFIGDPYDFTILNRRRSEDGTDGTDPMWLTMTKTTIADYKGTVPNDSVIWTTSLAASPTATNTSKETADAATISHFSLQMTKTGNSLSQTGNGDGNYFLRTASLKQSSPDDGEGGLVGDYSNDQISPGINQTNNYWRLVAKYYGTAPNYTSYFEMVPFSLNDLDTYSNKKSEKNYSQTMDGLGQKQQLLTIRTAVAKDEDKADNDCFDADIKVYSDTHVKRIEREKMEIKYGKAIDEMPYSLRRYGCEYDCWLVTVDSEGLPVDSMQISNFDGNDKLTGITGYSDKTFREFVKEMDKTKYHLTYVYHVPEATSQYFTTASDAQTEDYTWMNTYFAWDQYYSGTNIEVEYYVDVFDHYVYSADGHIIDEVWRKERRTRIESNPTQAYPTTAFLNSHTSQDRIYADEGTQSESDRQKWALVGDPYDFTMKNYAQYLINSNSVLTLAGKDVEGTNITSDAQTFAITIDKNGKAYLAVIDENGEPIKSISFEYSTASDKRLQTVGTGTNLNDPTGNMLDVSNVKPFNLANLIRYADILQYHLVIAHQHSLDPEETYLRDLNTAVDGLTVDEAANRQLFKDHLLEFLMYKGIRKNEAGMYVNYTNGVPTSYRTDGATIVDNIKSLLKTDGSLRDFISYPIEDYSVSRVGIGNHPQVPWYMKRQFCRYYIYQRDIMRSVTDESSPACEVADASWAGATVTINGVTYKVNPSSPYRVNVVLYDGRLYLQGKAPGEGTLYQNLVQRTFTENGETKLAYNIKWASISDMSTWDAWDNTADGDPETGVNKDRAYYDTTTSKWLKKPKYYDDGIALNGKVLDKLQDCHYNRKVLLDVVYEVIPEEFRFATRGRNTTAWYQMMTNNAADGLMNFTYREGIGARMDRTEHYTNNYLWAPEGDPYGFVLRSRYATINGTGWDNVAVTTKGLLPKEDSTPSELTQIAEDALSDNPAIIALAKDKTFSSYFKKYQLLSLTNFGTAFGMGLVVMFSMISLGYAGGALVGLFGAVCGKKVCAGARVNLKVTA